MYDPLYKKNRRFKYTEMVHSRRQTRRSGGGCNGIVSIANASKRSNCQWERTSNGKAQLVPKLQSSRNMANIYSGGRSTRRSSKRRSIRGGGCNGIVSIANASKRSNCQWERTSNGKAKLVPKLQSNRNMVNIYSGGRRSTRRGSRRFW